MFKKLVHIFVLLLIAVIFYAVSFYANDWFSVTMPRHQLLQLPIMLVLGIACGCIFSSFKIKNNAYGIALLIFIMASLIFWMLPRSIDLTIVYPWFNRIMHLHILLVGFLIASVLPYVLFEAKIAFLLMVASMLITSGGTLKVFKILLCSSFTIEQQNETGLYLMFIGIIFFVGSIIFFFREIAKAHKKN